MVEKIQALRGMNDILPSESERWRALEQTFIHSLQTYGYREIRFPIVESTQLFKRSIGEVTDIVEKEMYTFADLNGDSLTLRPEGTAGCLRACIEHSLLYNQSQKLMYLGPMFRHERPQKGRYRQFHQMGAEAIGIAGFAVEVELIALSQRLWQALGLQNSVRLEINSLGELDERQRYKDTLVTYFKAHWTALDEDSQRRLHTNPLRILDSKNPAMQALLHDAPKLIDTLGGASKLRFTQLCRGLDALKIPYNINPVLVRGLDYYGHTVFEWVTDALGSQSTVCAGGRYDTLVAQLGGSSTPAVGFAIGTERLLLLMETVHAETKLVERPILYIITDSEEGQYHALHMAETIHNLQLSWCVLTDTTGGSFKSQFKKADKSGAILALILGEDELKNNQVSVKSLRREGIQVTISRDELNTYLHEYLGEK